MSYLAQSVNASGTARQVPSALNRIDKLPDELQAAVFSFLATKEAILTTTVVSKEWRKVVVITVRLKEFSITKQFLTVLAIKPPEILPRDPTLQMLKSAILQFQEKYLPTCTNILESTTLSELRSAILQSYNQYLQSLSPENLAIVEKRTLNSSVFLSEFSITASVVIAEKIRKAQLISNEEQRGNALKDISKDLMFGGLFDKGIAVASSIPNKDIRNETLLKFMASLMQAGDFVRAKAALNMVS